LLLWYAAGLRSRGRGKEKETGYKVRTEMVGPTRGRTVISQGKSRRAGEEGTAEENEGGRGGWKKKQEKKIWFGGIGKEGMRWGEAYYLYHVVVRRTHGLRPNHETATAF
jgi:hypothetical protein